MENVLTGSAGSYQFHVIAMEEVQSLHDEGYHVSLFVVVCYDCYFHPSSRSLRLIRRRLLLSLRYANCADPLDVAVVLRGVPCLQR